jgi:hypothetical protein
MQELKIENIAFPLKVKVKEVVQSRYKPGSKPLSWDSRLPGVEVVITDTSEELSLYSDGGQGSPAPGWELILRREASAEELASVNSEETIKKRAATWTLYGIS